MVILTNASDSEKNEMNHIKTDGFEPIHPAGHVPSYVPFYPEGRHLRRMEEAGALLVAQGRATSEDVERSLQFTERAHGIFSGRQSPDAGSSFVFAVPTRVTRENGHLYPSEITPFLPMVRNLTGKEMLYLLDGMPPCVIESYKENEQGEAGRVIFVPLFGDIRDDMQRYPRRLLGDARGSQVGDLAAGLIARTVINQAAKFAKHRLGAKVMGLGAILPALTRYGQTIHVDGLTTTTGHGGTVALIGETVSKAIEGVGLPSNRIGIIGSAGSIGRSSLALLLEQYPDASFDVHDVKTMERVMAALSPADKARVNVAKSIEDVFRSSKVVVSAITSTINLGKDHPSASLDGTVIIDDSQPGAFMRDEVESLGGRVVWVVGNDDSREGTATRVGGYQFGNDTGLHRSTNVWGCEAEAYSVATTGRLDLALRSAVTPEKARAIGELLKNCGIGVADYQSFGKPVDLL